MPKQKRVLCLFDYGENCFTGFATVSRNIVQHLKKQFKDNLQLDICAINYYGEPYYEPNGTYVFSAKFNDVQNDDFGRFLFLKILQDANVYDGIFIIQDIAIISPIVPHLKMLLEEKRQHKRKSFKSIVYFPVDCPLFPSIIEPLSFFDKIVTYTEYARDEVLKHCPHLKTKIKVIPHGNNSKDFFPIETKDSLAFRKEYFGENADKLIISNISRNQPRKDLASTIFAFIELKREWESYDLNKAPFLYLHCHPKDPLGWDLRAVMMQLGVLEENIDYMLLPKRYEDAMPSVQIVNKIYNSSDIILSTTLGEGYGLCFPEAAAAKKPIIAPYSTSFIEMSGHGKRGYMLKTLYPSCNTIDNAIRQQVDIYEVADMLALVAKKIIEHPIIKDKDLQARIEAAYEWSKSIEWANVCKIWVQYFNETF